LELLEQVGVAEEVVQAAFLGKSYAVYKDGRRQVRNAWQSMLAYMESSFHGYITNIRQKKSEDILISRYRQESGKEVHYGWKLQGHEVSIIPADEYNVTVVASHILHGQTQIRW
jgi:phenol 2-monooxygenase (NADPH)